MAKFICDCGKEFNKRLSLIYHQNTCTVYKYNHNIYTHHYDKAKCKYVCDCGKEFDKQSSLNTHATHCDKYKKPEKVFKTKINGKYVCECGKEFDTRDAYAGHASYCEIHHKANNTQRKKRPHELNHSLCWDKLTEEEIKNIRKKGIDTLRKRYANGELKSHMLGKHHTEETKQKLREAYASRLSAKGAAANFTEKACMYLDKLNQKYDWHLQHGMNGGEVIICGYYVDGYDKDLNIVVEYDERSHYIDPYNNVLRKKDIERQNNIILKLNCRFYRYNEVTDKLYEVHIDTFDIFNEFDELIKENKINFESRETIKESLKKYSQYSYKSFLSYSKTNKEVYNMLPHKMKPKTHRTHHIKNTSNIKLKKTYIDKNGNSVTFAELKSENQKRYRDELIRCCETSGIDFKKFGWSEKVKKWLNENSSISFQNTLYALTKYYPEFIEKYNPFLRKSVYKV